MEALRPTPVRHRNREFSEVRGDHSNRSAMSRSQLEPSRLSNISANSRLDPSRNRNPQPTRIAYNHNKSYNDTASKSADKLLCVDCFNKQFSNAKRQRKRREAEREKARTKTSLINEEDQQHRHARNQHQKQYEDVQAYNKRAMREKALREQKAKQERQRKNQQILREQLENTRLLQEKEAINNQRREILKRQLEEQIKDRRERKQREQEEEKQIQPMFGDSGRRQIQRDIEQHYRQDLLHQIEQNKLKRERRAAQQKRQQYEQEFQLHQFAEEKEREKKMMAERRRVQMLEEARRMSQIQNRKQRQEERRKREEELEVRRQMQATVQQWKMKEDVRRNQIGSYLGDLKKQMENNQRRKHQQEMWEHEKPSYSPFMERPEVPERECDSCEKRYPEMYLTKVHEPMEL